MLNRLGRGLAPTAPRLPFPFRYLNFANTLPAEVTFVRNSKATCRNAEGKLIEVGINEPRLNHTEDGTSLGLYIEHSATNKCKNHNINPVDTSEFLTGGGAGTLSVVDDTAELLAAGLDQICTSGKVYKAEATTSSTFIVYILGNTNNTDAHSMSLYARGENGSGTTARLALGGAELPIAETGENYQRYKYENVTPDSTGRKFTIAINGNQTLYFILNQLEEGVESTSIIPIEGDDVTRPTDRAYINNVDQQDWFNPAQGYMVCRHSHEKLLNNDVYLSVFNNEGSSNTIGFRIDGSAHRLKGYVRSSSSSQHANTNDDNHIERILNSAGIRWNSTDIDVLSGGSFDTRTMSNLPTGINALEIGARNGGSGPIYGHILSLEISTQDITLQQLGNKVQKQNDLCLVGAGQSLIRGHFISQEDNSNDGKQKLREVVGKTNLADTFIFLDGSTGSSAACKTTSASNFWWDNATSTRGPAFDNFYQEIDNVGTKPTAILWGQGEEDSHVLDINTSKADYKNALTAIFTDIRQNLGNIPVYIQHIGRRTDFTNTGGIQSIRDIQKEFIVENTWCHSAAEIYDLTLHDTVHLSNNGYETAAERNNLALLNKSGAKGPTITSASRAGTTITVTLTHDNGDDFIPTSSIEGFIFFDDTTSIAITNAIKVNSTTINLTLASTPSSGTETLYYGYDDMAGLNTVNIITDNATIPMPLRTAKINVT